MKKFFRVLMYAQRLFWFLELIVSPQHAADVLLNQSRVRRWLGQQPPQDQQKIREAAPLVVAAILASLD